MRPTTILTSLAAMAGALVATVPITDDATAMPIEPVTDGVDTDNRMLCGIVTPNRNGSGIGSLLFMYNECKPSPLKKDGMSTSATIAIQHVNIKAGCVCGFWKDDHCNNNHEPDVAIAKGQVQGTIGTAMSYGCMTDDDSASQASLGFLNITAQY
ncbi:hypothetical protein BCR34DRAFT_173232 [Clohesyomyces aquaticus]|uniref:Uncharacterized protein n=1 Tax=Clohesyomyces aquaticus TaxID=1231657 RepID=A0A1Y1YGB0_9PLEO|nr:hypothetical protein BCR34DRAFT_173232 [Clohesyomyces aquaticus]